MDYKTLTGVKHPDYDCDYWKKLRVLYKGGKELRDALRTDRLIRDEIFPKHLGETEEVYQERLKRFFYANNFESIIKAIVCTLGSDPVRLSADPEPEPFYAEFAKDTSRPGGKRLSLNKLLLDCTRDALLYKRTWLLVDFPTPSEGGEKPLNRLEEEMQGLDRAYCVTLDPEQVYDWEEDASGGLEWVLIHGQQQKRESVEAERNNIVETFTLYDRKSWTRFTYNYKQDNPPNDNALPTMTESGVHSFGEVPVLRLELSDDLWAGSMLESLACEHLNKYCAIGWAQYRSLFQMQVAYLSSPDALNPVTEDDARAFNQIEGPGRVKVMAEKDRIEMIGPSAEPFKEAREFVKELKDEMYRVVHQMASAHSSSSSALGRSAESKQIDQSSTIIVAKEIGSLVQEFAEDLYDLVSAGRRDPLKQWTASGFAEFEELKANTLIEEAVALETVNIPSPTFHRLYKYRLARDLAPEATEADLLAMEAELKNSITAESLDMGENRAAGLPGDTGEPEAEEDLSAEVPNKGEK